MTVAPRRERLENFLEIGLRRFGYFLVPGSHRSVHFNFQHLGEVSAVPIHFFIPLEHCVVVALDSLDHAVSKVVVVVSQQSGCLLWRHPHCSGERVQDELKSALGLVWLLADVHFHDVHTFVHHYVLSLRPGIVVDGVKVEDVLVHRDPLDVILDPNEDTTDFL